MMGMHRTGRAPRAKTSAGFTITELMVAIVIALILMAGVIQIFVSSKRGHLVEEGLGRLQENARYAMSTIGEDIRMAGYTGCSGNIQNLLDTTSPAYSDDLFNFETATGGWEYTGSGTKPGDNYLLPSNLDPAGQPLTDWTNHSGGSLPPSIQDKVAPGSDLLVLKWAAEKTGVTPNGNTPAHASSISLTGSNGLPQGTIVVISDCQGADVFQNRNTKTSHSLSRGSGSNTNPGPSNVQSCGAGGSGAAGCKNFSHAYTTTARMLYATSRAYYISKGINGEPALYRIRYDDGVSGAGSATAIEEIADGVETLQVLFGEDTDGDKIANQYVTADQVTDYANVVSVKLGMLIRSPNEVKATAASRVFDVLGTKITTPKDRYLRLVFTSTIKIRNKGIM
ncbi:MAG TPA: PilW family protein [Gammaproteobacteria bacterium]|nr:PilW family protein [Gammaproteobacteria bacterium]